ncbi:MAG: slipin family protein [Clostridiales Family XIII bacterium]|jgi:regulator of protease activity HflC (stomatin/prohibitin superfamily)|nr:slipin family protein [Clostridiales Family XIII bacterium]
MKAIINENQRGLLYRDGRFTAYLKPGKHRRFGTGYRVEIVQIEDAFNPTGASIEVFLRHPALAQELDTVDVADETLAIHYRNGKYAGTLQSGKYAFWNVHDRHSFQVVDLKAPDVSETIPRYLFAHIPPALFTKVEVADYEKARLCHDGQFVRLLEPGTHYFWNNGTRITAQTVDTRALQMDITGQEILTQDKVSLRINFVCTYRITDYVRIHTELDDYERQIHILLQLALREYVGKYRLDEILDNKEQLSSAMFARLKEKEAALFVTFAEAGVKDIILPGEIRDIMNTVLLAEKRAHANVITRREEVASTRSLLNTAKLMDENQTLYKLKELEYLEKICAGVDSISVNGGSDLLAQLANLLKGGTSEA